MWVKDQGIDVVMPMSSLLALSALPFLPESTAVVLRANSITRHTYRLITRRAGVAAACVVLTPRQKSDLDLRGGPGLPPVFHVPNCFPPGSAFGRRALTTGRIRILYAGRLEHFDKGVLHLPGIVHVLERLGVDYSLTIAGGGPDEGRLRRRLVKATSSGRVAFAGVLDHRSMQGVLAEHDVLILPSHFEGFPSTVVEGMAAGCVPVASRIAGVTDWIIRDELTGLLCRIGDEKEFAARIAHLSREREQLKAMASRAQGEVRARFSPEKMAEAYAGVFRYALSNGRRGCRRVDLENLVYDPMTTWHQFIPALLKDRLRPLLERLRAAAR
jgi:glycosyltransferase involved in cell wall biosynthesis